MNQAALLELHRTVVYKSQTAIGLLGSLDELSPEQVIQCFENGAVWLESGGKPRRIYDPETTLKPGQKIHLYCNQTTLEPCPLKATLVQDFGDFSIWNKPSGMLSQGSKWGDHWALYHWIKQNYWPQRESFITHRLDRFTAGLIIVAHNEATNKQFHRLFESREIHKTYRAIVAGLMTPGEQITLTTPIDNKNAETRVRVLEQQVDTQQSLLEIKPVSGRKHQIRIHLAGIGHPVINDRNYGQAPFNGDLRLQACELEFIHPIDHSKVHICLEPGDLLTFC